MSRMRIFEPHIHMISRTTSDYEKMAQAGIEVVLEPSFWLGEPRKHPGTFFDYFDHIINFETQRAAQYGIDHYAAISINPRESNNRELAEAVLKELPRFLDNKRVLAVGEIGFDRITGLEEHYLRKQLELAKERNLPVLVHSPHLNKLEGIKKTIRILKEMSYKMDMVLLDHNVEKTTPLSKKAGCWCGHTLYPITKLTPERVVNIIEKNGVDKMMINSSADWGPSDPLMVVYTIKQLEGHGFSMKQIQKLVWNNPVEFFSKSCRMNIK